MMKRQTLVLNVEFEFDAPLDRTDDAASRWAAQVQRTLEESFNVPRNLKVEVTEVKFSEGSNL